MLACPQNKQWKGLLLCFDVVMMSKKIVQLNINEQSLFLSVLRFVMMSKK